MSPPSPPLLQAVDLTFVRDASPIFDQLAFEVDHAEALLVQGENGAGKTTLLRVLAGLLAPEQGEVRLKGELMRPSRGHADIAYLGHLPALKADLTAAENLDLAAGLLGKRDGHDVEAALARVGLAGYDDQLARSLSAGQRKRLMLARVWSAPAALWLLDEPYANLDLEGIALVNDLISEHVGEGGAALVTTHGAYAAPPVRTRTLHLVRAS
ncbi:heme ABC exporter ATP-binding protein CcmA [Lysobacter soyae]|uniref:Heme ABC exporter ATP-binding protein CcmA n=1 Tax=Lysobacter soyae TaxID=2764185 RepID=A0ABX8WQA8_9GAMM|nr:heme ABC exporter ATP-binding protein CcmA [Lysobacter sp. CJ11]QYR52192.1 heme ABC exporter ATP-binding protein CcmA [Lysobacter sp. CJ11]